MRSSVFLVVALVACGTDHADFDPAAPRTFSFGPYTVQPSQEISDQCVQITLNNDQPIYVNEVDLTTGPGFHHSNWFFVPETLFPGPHGNMSSSADDGTFTCDDRHFDQAVVSIYGGTLFAQSTQAAHGVQQFPAGVAVKIPEHFKLVSQIHLLNAGDAAVTLNPTITIKPIAEADVTTKLAGMGFENHALGLPPQKQSSFTVDCDLAPEWQILYSKGFVTSDHPDFHIYYALAHYHGLGTGMTIEAVKPDGTAATVYSTAASIGDSLGQTLSPVFDMNGYTRLRMTCDYYNSRSTTVGWGIGDQEMCVMLAFSDSNYLWGGGAVNDDPPGDATDVNGVMSFSHSCMVFANDATR